jgi:hypothetical protein
MFDHRRKNAACPSGTGRHEHFTVFAPQLGRWKQIWTYLPPGY